MIRTSERGSAIIWIMIAVALFGALGFAFSQGSRSSVNLLTQEQTSTYARQLISYGNDIKQAVKRLQLRGCEDENISFENDILSGYVNVNNPPDTCLVYHPDGGGLSYVQTPSDMYDPNDPSPAKVLAFLQRNAFQDIGTTCGTADCVDVILFSEGLRQELCIEINNQLGITNPGGSPPVDSDFQGGGTFVGTFASGQIIGDEAGSSVLAGRQAGCFYEDDGSPTHIFYRILIAR